MSGSVSARARARGLKLKEIREARAWSQGELAARAHTTQATISRYEDGRNIPYEVAVRLADALEVHPLEILEPEQAPSPEEKRLIRTYRGLSDEKRDMLDNFLDALNAPPKRKAG